MQTLYFGLSRASLPTGSVGYNELYEKYTSYGLDAFIRVDKIYHTYMIIFNIEPELSLSVEKFIGND
jgi:hypothetical protein